MKRKRYANGPERPQYLASSTEDHAVMMILSLAAEVSALRERLDTHERLAATGQRPTEASIDAYEPSEAVEESRAALRRDMIDRLTRVLLEPTGAAKPKGDST